MDNFYKYYNVFNFIFNKIKTVDKDILISIKTIYLYLNKDFLIDKFFQQNF